MSLYPIGFFDSGIGGITLWKSIKSLLPHENTIYLSDSKNCPYGGKSQKEIDKICFNNTKFLIEKKCKIIVVACNTATTNSISKLRDEFKIPFIGIEPAIKPAALKTKTKKIGVLATKGTLMSNLFAETSSDYKGDVKFINTEVLGLVELIENGNCEKELNLLLIKYLKPMLEKGIDQLVLGCTHYPLIKKSIKKIIGDKVNIIDCNHAVALQTKKILELNNLLNTNKKNPAQHYFFNSGDDNFTIGKVLENEYEIFKFEY
jgi:glutamate racemase